MKMEQTECFETVAYKIQTLGNYPEESIQHFDVYRVCVLYKAWGLLRCDAVSLAKGFPTFRSNKVAMETSVIAYPVIRRYLS
jgi:hypothetical protein